MLNELNTLKGWLSKVGLKQSSNDIGRLIRASVAPVTLEGMPSVALGDISLEDEDSEDEYTLDLATKEVLVYMDPWQRTRRIIIANSKGGPKAFYNSTGTGTPGRVREGQWVPFNGIAELRGSPWFVKDSLNEKIPEGEMQEISWAIENYEEENGSFTQTVSIGSPTLGDGPKLSDERLKEMGEVNKWLQNHGALYREKFGEASGMNQWDTEDKRVNDYANFYGVDAPYQGGLDAFLGY